MTLNSKRDLDTVKVNPHAKCLLKPSFRAKIILETVTPRILDRSHYLDHYTQPFNGPLDYPEETFTHSHASWSSDSIYQLIPSTTIHNILVQFTCLTVLFHNLSPGPLWSSSWYGTLYFILVHFFTESSSSFHNTRPYHCNLFFCSTEIMSSILSLSSAHYLGICLLS